MRPSSAQALLLSAHRVLRAAQLLDALGEEWVQALPWEGLVAGGEASVMQTSHLKWWGAHAGLCECHTQAGSTYSL